MALLFHAVVFHAREAPAISLYLPPSNVGFASAPEAIEAGKAAVLPLNVADVALNGALPFGWAAWQFEVIVRGEV